MTNSFDRFLAYIWFFDVKCPNRVRFLKKTLLIPNRIVMICLPQS
jgi:hypothetical protein